MTRSLVATAVVLLAACNQNGSPTAPFLDKSVTGDFTASISKSSIVAGDTATLHFALKNTGTDTLRMQFTSGCPILPYVQKAPNGSIVYPEGGNWSCAAGTFELVLAPGAQHEVTVLVHAGTPAPANFSGAALPSGSYGAYALLTNGKGRTNTVAFTTQ